MKFIADESVDYPIITRLRADGHEVFAIVESSAGISDEQVLEHANQQELVLLTNDKDFGELVYRDKGYTCGIMLFRPAGLNNLQKAEIVAGVIEEHMGELENAFTVISPYNIRIRRRL